MRKQPAITPPVINTDQYKQDRTEQITTQVREYQLITPLFGGGVVPAEADPITIIRGSEIRGQLRFWWRACRGGQFNNDVQLMKDAEDKIWGAAASRQENNRQSDSEESRQQQTGKPLEYKQPVQILVEAKKTKPEDYVYPFTKSGYNAASGIPKYLAFPLEEEQQPVCKNITFTLTISFPREFQKDVEAALWAWETFGGLGARTRRGFGALQQQNLDDDNQDIAPKNSNPQVVTQWIKDHLNTYISGYQYPANIPHLSKTSQFYVVGNQLNASIAWNGLIRKLSSFRQYPDGRDQRSKWPEAEEIRELTSRGYRSRRLHPHKFPRAAFGLPIIFHFKDGVPDDTTLQIKDHDRFASPLILRPLACQDGKAVGIAILLEPHTPPRELILKRSGQSTRRQSESDHVDATLRVEEAKQIDVPVIRKGQTDVLLAFLDYLRGDR